MVENGGLVCCMTSLRLMVYMQRVHRDGVYQNHWSSQPARVQCPDHFHRVCMRVLRPAGGDPWVDRPQKYFFEGLCFFEWTWPFWTPLKGFREESVWFKLRKRRRKVAPFLTPLGAARAARSADWLKIDKWENPSFDSTGSRQLVGTLRYALTLSSDVTCTSTHVRVSLVSPLHAYRWACYWKRSSRQR